MLYSFVCCLFETLWQVGEEGRRGRKTCQSVLTYFGSYFIQLLLLFFKAPWQGGGVGRFGEPAKQHYWLYVIQCLLFVSKTHPGQGYGEWGGGTLGVPSVKKVGHAGFEPTTNAYL